jgi:uncharacterized membrane protein YqhA
VFEQLLKVRYLAVVVVVVAILHAMAFLFMGTQAAVTTYWHILDGQLDPGSDRPGLELLHALDALLVALVMILLAVGVAKLFLLPHHEGHPEGHSRSLPRWLDIESFSDLKYVLWETILLALLVFGLSSLSADVEQLTWSSLVIPAAILMLALSLFLMKRTR